jgi:glutamate synthase (NADPH/NADH) small chain
MRLELGEPDENGCRRATPIPGSEHELPAHVAIIGVGTTANPLIQSTTPDLKTDKRNYIAADPETLRTSKRGVLAGGDIVTGSATVILAMGAGRKAAKGIDESLRSGEWAQGYVSTFQEDGRQELCSCRPSLCCLMSQSGSE